MYASQEPWVELYAALLAYDGTDAYFDVLEPWIGSHAVEICWLAGFAGRDVGPADDEDLCRLYAASRVTTLLLLNFQTGRADGSDYRGPPVSSDGFLVFHEALGCRVAEPRSFHPFFHEIVTVRPSLSPAAPVRVVENVWPTLMLGQMMFCRGGCVVEGGTDHLMPRLAEGSLLYWAFRRKNRPHEDQSHGWGGNSQWRTAFRRDYQAADGFRFNVDGRTSLDAAAGTLGGVEVATLVEVVRNRCLVRTAADEGTLNPYSYRLTEPAGQR